MTESLDERPPLIASSADLHRFRPEWCVFWAGSVNPSQFEIWRPYIARSRYRHLVLARRGTVHPDVMEAIRGMPNVRAMEATDESVRELKGLPGFRGFMYVLGFKPATFEAVNTFRNHAHVWIGHGESRKRSSAPRSASIYDAIFSGGYGRIKAFPRSIRPWVGRMACAIGAPIMEGLVADPWQAPRPVRTILYIPTWEGYSPHTDYSSLARVAPSLIEAMPGLVARGTRILVAPHRRTGSRVATDRAVLDSLIEAGAELAQDKVAAFTAADIALTDVSGVNAEFLFTRKPILMAPPARIEHLGRPWTDILAEHPWAYAWDPARGSIVERIAALERSDPLAGRREQEARRIYRGHRSLDEAVRTFDLALWAVGWRKSRIPVRVAFELGRRGWVLPRLTRRLRPVIRAIPVVRRLAR
jgi:hypothetical protein